MRLAEDILPAEMFQSYYSDQGRESGVAGWGVEQLVASVSSGPADYVAGMKLTRPEIMCMYFSRMARGGV